MPVQNEAGSSEEMMVWTQSKPSALWWNTLLQPYGWVAPCDEVSNWITRTKGIQVDSDGLHRQNACLNFRSGNYLVPRRIFSSILVGSDGILLGRHNGSRILAMRIDLFSYIQAQFFEFGKPIIRRL